MILRMPGMKSKRRLMMLLTNCRRTLSRQAAPLGSSGSTL